MKSKSKKLKIKERNASGFPALLFFLCLFTFYFLLLPASTYAQDEDPAPPPLKLISKEERTRLEAASDIKARTRLVVDMMKARLDTVEKLNTANDFNGMFRELGAFRALLDYCVTYLQKQNQDEGKTLDNYKRLEMGLRAFTPRIEAVRRELPMQYEEYVRDLLKHIRDVRQKASDAMFSNTVLPPEKSK